MRLGIILLVLFLLPCWGVAGEKEELLLQQALLNERLGRLQAEFTLTQQLKKELDERIKAMEVTPPKVEKKEVK